MMCSFKTAILTNDAPKYTPKYELECFIHLRVRGKRGRCQIRLANARADTKMFSGVNVCQVPKNMLKIETESYYAIIA